MKTPTSQSDWNLTHAGEKGGHLAVSQPFTYPRTQQACTYVLPKRRGNMDPHSNLCKNIHGTCVESRLELEGEGGHGAAHRSTAAHQHRGGP